MATALSMSESAFRSRYVAASGDRLRDGLAGRCPLLADGRAASCQVYDARPEQCRTWPFWPELLASDERLRAAARLCPGIEIL